MRVFRTTTVVNPDSMTHHLEKLRTELTELRTRASAKHPDVIRVQGEIAAIEKALAERPKKRSWTLLNRRRCCPLPRTSSTPCANLITN